MRAAQGFAIIGLLLGFAASSPAYAEQALRLELLPDAKGVRIVLQNSSTFDVKTVCRFAIGSEGDPFEIKLRIINQHGVQHPYQLKSSGALPGPSDWCDLRPNQLAGVYLPNAEIQYAFELPPGTYTVQALYLMRDGSGKEVGYIQSNTIQIRI